MQAARGIIVEDGKILLLERRRHNKDGKELHYLSIPGGQVEPDETAEIAVAREFQEELGIEVKVGALVAHVYMTAEQWYASQEHSIYLCERIKGEPVFKNDSPEAADKSQFYGVMWRSLNEIDNEPRLHDIYRPVVTALLPYLQSGTIPQTPIDIDVANLL